MEKFQAIEYLYKNNVYGDEWIGAGMWEAVVRVLESEKEITKEFLDELLKEAYKF